VVADFTATGLPEFEQTLTVSTHRGFHYYFAADAIVSITTAGVLPNVDTRCNGSFVILPPSRHKSDNYYEWFRIAKLQKLPFEFRKQWRAAYFQSSCGKQAFRLPSIIPKGTRNDTLWR
jgi:hypothetical protein